MKRDTDLGQKLSFKFREVTSCKVPNFTDRTITEHVLILRQNPNSFDFENRFIPFRYICMFK